MRSWIALLLLLFGCAPSSYDDFQAEGEAHARCLVKEFQKIESTEQLQEAAPRLKKRFSALVDLMIEARTYQVAHPDDFESSSSVTDKTFNELLVIELERLYKLERGRDIIEKAQREPLHRLDAFEQQLKKRREKL